MTETRNLRLDLFPDADSAESRHTLNRRVVNSIRHYRAVLRKCFSALAMAQTAGAKIEIGESDESDIRVLPDRDQSKAILAAAFGHDGKALAYQLRSHVLTTEAPAWMSFVWDSLRRDLQTAWTAKDPEFTRANRGYLVLNGARNFGMFSRRGIGFPVATARPKLADHSLTLKWHREFGSVEFRIGRLDTGRWRRWQSVVNGDEGWDCGTVYLNERDGQLFAVVSHSIPTRGCLLDVGLTMEITINADAVKPEIDNVMVLRAPGSDPVFVSAADVLYKLAQHATARNKLERCRAACGSPIRSRGDRKSWHVRQEQLHRRTVNRTRLEAHWNHAWSRCAVDWAKAMGCGKIRVTGLPEDGKLGEFSWSWSEFRADLEYKSREVGIELVAE